MVIRVVGNPSFVIFQDRRFGMGKTAAANFQPTEPFPAPSVAVRIQKPRNAHWKLIPSVSAPAPSGVVSLAISSTIEVPDVGRDGNRWTDFSPVAFACQLPRGRALKTRCGSTVSLPLATLGMFAIPVARKPNLPGLARPWHHLTHTTHTRKPHTGWVVMVGSELAGCRSQVAHCEKP